MSFHEIRFPTDISRGATGGPGRRTDVVTLGSGHEERNSRWASSRRSFDAGYGVRSLDDLHTVIAFFEERRGRLYGFRWKDQSDYKSSLPASPLTADDQQVGIGDGVTTVFQLAKTYGENFAPFSRAITKPVQGSLLVAVNGATVTEGTDFTADYTSGELVFQPGSIPGPGSVISAGFEFDVPVRFDTDILAINVASFAHGSIPSVPVIEVRL